MERPHRASSSAAQPASKRSKPSTDPSGGASGSAAQPATLLEQVEQLGHYPKRFKKPTTDTERAENSLAKKISKQWSMLSDVTQAELARLQKETKGKDAEAEPQNQGQDILEQVEQLGHYPKRFEKPATDKERTENSLAKRISKEWSKLDDATKAELARLQQPATLLKQVEQLGHYPKRRENPATDKERT